MPLEKTQASASSFKAPQNISLQLLLSIKEREEGS